MIALVALSSLAYLLVIKFLHEHEGQCRTQPKNPSIIFFSTMSNSASSMSHHGLKKLEQYCFYFYFDWSHLAWCSYTSMPMNNFYEVEKKLTIISINHLISRQASTYLLGHPCSKHKIYPNIQFGNSTKQCIWRVENKLKLYIKLYNSGE